MSKKSIYRNRSAVSNTASQTIPSVKSVPRDLTQFLDDAANFRISDEASIDAVFRAFAAQHGSELFNDQFVQRWLAENPVEDFSLIYDLLDACSVPHDQFDAVTYLELACFLYDTLPKPIDCKGARASSSSYYAHNTALMSLSNLGQNCRYETKR